MNGFTLKRLAITAALGLSGLTTGAADSLFKDPVISVSPRTLNFGAVSVKASVTNSILVENWGGGKLVGKATVAKPFKILSGAAYKLGAADAQVITIVYAPSAAGLDTNVIKFTGGGGAVVPVIGKALEKKDR